MNAIQLLRTMHAETKVSFKLILSDDTPVAADARWQALKPLLTLHEQMEDEFLYTPLHTEMLPGTVLGDWELWHDSDVANVKDLIQVSETLEPGTPQWRMCIARIMDALAKHVSDEEGQIFPRIEQVWAPERLERAAGDMQKILTTSRGTATAAARPAQPARRKR